MNPPGSRWGALAICILSALAASGGRANAQQTARSRHVDRIVGRVVQPDGPGAAVLVVSRGEVVHRRGYGLAEIATARAITAETAFELASVSKQFTAMAVMILAERGQLAYHDALRQHLPEMPRYDTARPIRLADLLHHTSGIVDYMEVWEGTDDEFSRLTNTGVLRLLARQPLTFSAGTKYEYSNSNYALLALVVERTSGKPFADFLADEIFRPLEMRRARVRDGRGPEIANVARGYTHNKQGKVRLSEKPSIVYGDGSLFTTIDDLARWDQGLRANTLVSAATLKRAFTPGKLDSGRRHDYGFGWEDDSTDGRRSVGHSGSWYGASNYLCRYLDDELTVAVLSNDEKLDAGQLVEDVADVYFSAADGNE